MPTTVTVTGQGGIQAAGSGQPIGQNVGPPPELHGAQWGLYRLDIGHRPQEKV